MIEKAEKAFRDSQRFARHYMDSNQYSHHRASQLNHIAFKGLLKLQQAARIELRLLPPRAPVEDGHLEVSG